MELSTFGLSSASDCYAFGMAILELITLERPFAQFDHEIGAARAAEKGIHPTRPPKIKGLPEETADVLWSLLERVWAQDPLKRPTLAVVKADLDRISSFRFHSLT